MAPPKKRTKKTSRATKAEPEKSPRLFPVVGIGASAGGMEAFGQMLEDLPADTGMAFVFIQHLHPGYDSALVDILSRHTSMPVLEAGNDMEVEPNSIYVIPPGSYLAIENGVLRLLPRPESHEPRLPVDQFFRTLAADRGTGAIGVLLSGTGSDGMLGLKAIKAEGGITFAQDETSAKYDGMPHSAIASGAVDFILPVGRIASELEHVARHPLLARERAGTAPEATPAAGDSLNRIFMLMRRHSGHDFTYYKTTTIQRRIRRRMVLHKLERLEDYVRYLQDNSAELDDLFQDILINVTDFFRDPEVFEVLAEKVFPMIVPEGRHEKPVRIWVPGCSSGEEAYSIAIALAEYLGDRASSTVVQIFATDIDEVAIRRARSGVYPENIIQDVSPNRLRRYFTQVEGGYQVNKSIRDLCVFAVQNVTKDPPFSRLDLISCRNLLIYLGGVLQKRVMRTFHYALNHDGFLLLGTAESVGEFTDLFRAVDAKSKIYARKATTGATQLAFGMPAEAYAGAGPTPVQPVTPGQPTAGTDDGIQKEADLLLMNRYAPAAVVINENMDILLFRGRTGAYLEPTPGEASLNLFKMAREDLIVGLNGAVRESLSSHAAASRRDIRLQVNGSTRNVDIEVTPLPAHGSAKEHRYYLVVFREIPSPRVIEPEEGSATAGTDSNAAHLEQELAATKEYLQSVIEQKEINNEELRSANEEVQSSNEELQSINEELETAKEELQSTNEELATVNEELESRNDELTQVNNDLVNLVASVEIPIVIINRDLQIRRFTPQAEKLLNLIATDVGRPISDIKPNIEVPDFNQMLIAAIDEIKTGKQEIQDQDGCWYSVQVRPYQTLDNRIDGAIVVFVEVDEMKRALDQAGAARDYAEAIITAVRDPMLVLDRNLRVVSASAAYLETFQVSDQETRDNLVHRLGNGQWAIPRLRELLKATANEGVELDEFTVTHDFERIGTRTFEVSARQIPARLPEGPMVLMQIQDTDAGCGKGEVEKT